MRIINYIVTFIKELFLAVFCLCIAPFTLRDPYRKEGVPIILVHGYFYNSAGFRWMRQCLRNNGYKNIFAINLGNPLLSIEEYAKSLKDKLDQVAEETGEKDFVLIGHSMGGLVCLTCLKNYFPDSGHKVITLGTPHFGTYLAYLGIGKCAKEMRYQSPFTQDLHRYLQGSKVHLNHIASKSDEFIFPFRAEDVKPVERLIVYDRLGHLEMLFSEEVHRNILEILKSG